MDHIRPTFYKILLLGEAGVGKTALVRRFAHRIFEKDYKATLGVDMITKTIKLGSTEIPIQIWDFSGQELFGSLRAQFYLGATAALLIYDVSNHQSFDQLERWNDELMTNVGKIPLVLVGNKTDLTLLRVISSIDGDKKATGLDATHFTTSAKTGKNVDKVFETIASQIIEGD